MQNEKSSPWLHRLSSINKANWLPLVIWLYNKNCYAVQNYSRETSFHWHIFDHILLDFAGTLNRVGRRSLTLSYAQAVFTVSSMSSENEMYPSSVMLFAGDLRQKRIKNMGTRGNVAKRSNLQWSGRKVLSRERNRMSYDRTGVRHWNKMIMFANWNVTDSFRVDSRQGLIARTSEVALGNSLCAC